VQVDAHGSTVWPARRERADAMTTRGVSGRTP
jgi:hypothetical protein